MNDQSHFYICKLRFGFMDYFLNSADNTKFNNMSIHKQYNKIKGILTKSPTHIYSPECIYFLMKVIVSQIYLKMLRSKSG